MFSKIKIILFAFMMVFTFDTVAQDLPWLVEDSKKVMAEKKAAEKKAEEAAKKEAEKGIPIASIEYGASKIELPQLSVDKIDAIIASMKKDKNQRITMRSYASKTSDKPAEARRVALKRALSIRSYFLSRGIDATRIVVQAVGDKAKEDEVKDRVDFFKA